jgi:hypothetical protein
MSGKIIPDNLSTKGLLSKSQLPTTSTLTVPNTIRKLTPLLTTFIVETTKQLLYITVRSDMVLYPLLFTIGWEKFRMELHLMTGTQQGKSFCKMRSKDKGKKIELGLLTFGQIWSSRRSTRN